MKKVIVIPLLFMLILGLWCSKAGAQTSPGAMPSTLVPYPWAQSELVEPAVLDAAMQNTPAKLPLILNIGAVEDIKGAKHIGPVSKAENMQALRNEVAALSKTTPLVIYCGCCPFTKCPNIRPAYFELKKMGFTNVKLLNLPVNLQTNWIAKDYPLAAK